jgi:predicted DNA-binding transcriptional regulator AlpA
MNGHPCNYWSKPMDMFQLSKKIALNENELATRWGISPKTLQRWRCEGRGPKYFKLSKRVSYPIDEILAFEFESLHESTDGVTCDPEQFSNPSFLTAREIAAKIDIPIYMLAHPGERKKCGVPHYRIGKMVRFKLEEILSWARQRTAEVESKNQTPPRIIQLGNIQPGLTRMM